MFYKLGLSLRHSFYPDPILSVHIPKTAGTSFLNTLVSVYGNHQIGYHYGGIRPKRAIYCQVIHGHYNPIFFKKKFPNSKMICWMRDPVERIISWYYFWHTCESLDDELFVKFKKEKPSLLEFSSWQGVKHELRDKYFKKINLTDFTFIGFTENYDEDLIKLSKVLKWKNYKSFKKNITKEKPAVINDLRDNLKRNLESEFAIYEEAKKLFN